jgi:hypothetical protein
VLADKPVFGRTLTVAEAPEAIVAELSDAPSNSKLLLFSDAVTFVKAAVPMFSMVNVCAA